MNRLTLALLGSVAMLGFASSPYAADLIVETPVVEPGIVNVSGNWDGPYVGVFAGWGWGTADHTNAVAPSPCAPTDGCDVDMSGWLLGVTAGANFTVSGSFVLGVAGDIAWSNVSGEDTFPTIGVSENSINWEGSVRGVAGFDGGAFMPYVTAGLAFANASHTSQFSTVEADATHVGWTAGVGVAFAVADNVSLDLQYRHSWYDEQEYDMGFTPNNPVFALQTDRVTLGVNLGF